MVKAAESTEALGPSSNSCSQERRLSEQAAMEATAMKTMKSTVRDKLACRNFKEIRFNSFCRHLIFHFKGGGPF